MPWAEVQATPPAVLAERLEALARRRARERAENLRDRAASNEINRGQEIVGTLPPTKSTYKVVDRPYERYVAQLERQGQGLPPEELPEEREQRKAVETRRLADALLR